MEENHWNWFGIVGMGLVIALVGGALGFGLGVWLAPSVRPDLATSEVDPRVEYYRGVYDSCVSFLIDVMSAPDAEARTFCAEEIVVSFAEDGFYEQERPGYVPPP